MGVIMHKGVAYGGGSNVEANPAGSATDDLSKIGIDGTVYDITDADAVHSADIGVADGVAGLDSNGKVPSGQLPTYPTVNDGTLTIKQNGASKGTFTANQSTAATVELTDTTYSDATTSASGLMSSTDKTKLNGIANGAEVNVQSDWNVTDSGSDAYIKNKPSIPAAQVNSDWNATSGVAQILNKPTIPSVATKYDSSDTAETTLADDDKIPFYDTSASGRRNSTWANIKAKLKSYFDGIYSTFSGAYSDLTGKPTLGTAAAKDVPSSGNASSSQVVMGNDSRLTDSRNAADVSAWAKAANKPTYTASEVGAIPLSGSSAITGSLTPNTDDSIGLGTSSKRYQNVYAKLADVTDVLTVGKQGDIGELDIIELSGYYSAIRPVSLTANRVLYQPNSSGIIATEDWVNGTFATASTGTITKGSSTPSAWTLDNTTCIKVGNIVFASGRVYGSSSVTSSGNFFVLPTGFRPPRTTGAFGYMVISSMSMTTPLAFTIATSGVVGGSFSSGHQTTQVYFYAVFPVV